VGKTSVAAATAVRLAALGRRTLVISTDAAHSSAAQEIFDRSHGFVFAVFRGGGYA
jgi:anion-transporting  ArsA/GET3 family ATPase